MPRWSHTPREVLAANVLTKDVAMANNAAIPTLNSRNSQPLPSVGTRSESSTARFWPALAGSVGGFALLINALRAVGLSLSLQVRESSERAVPNWQGCDHDH